MSFVILTLRLPPYMVNYSQGKAMALQALLHYQPLTIKRIFNYNKKYFQKDEDMYMRQLAHFANKKFPLCVWNLHNLCMTRRIHIVCGILSFIPTLKPFASFISNLVGEWNKYLYSPEENKLQRSSKSSKYLTLILLQYQWQ